MKFLIPEGTARIVIRGRHSHSVQEGPNETRTLTTEGVALCAAVRNEYHELFAELAVGFGNPLFACSEYPRSMITTFLVTGAEQITADQRLNLDASVKKAPDPKGCHANLKKHWDAEGLTIPQMLQRLAADPSLFGNQPVEEALEHAKDFVLNAFPGNRLVVTFDHEPAIGLFAAQCGAAPEEFGLEECQANVFFLNAENKIIGVKKFTPTATIAVK